MQITKINTLCFLFLFLSTGSLLAQSIYHDYPIESCEMVFYEDFQNQNNGNGIKSYNGNNSNSGYFGAGYYQLNSNSKINLIECSSWIGYLDYGSDFEIEVNMSLMAGSTSSGNVIFWEQFGKSQ